MNNANIQSETIHLTLPINASYVSAARLTASSISNRMGFDIDEIEDIKAAVSEACTFIIKKLTGGTFTIIFTVSGNTLLVELVTNSEWNLNSSDDEMGIIVIKAFTDALEVSKTEDGKTVMTIRKTHKKLFAGDNY